MSYVSNIYIHGGASSLWWDTYLESWGQVEFNRDFWTKLMSSFLPFRYSYFYTPQVMALYVNNGSTDVFLYINIGYADSSV